MNTQTDLFSSGDYLVAWGIGETFHDAMSFQKPSFSLLVDGSPRKQGTTTDGFDKLIISPAELLNHPIDTLRVICFTPSFSRVKEFLSDFGFEHGVNLFYFLDFAVWHPVVELMSREREFVFLSYLVSPGDNVLDIGANVGLYSLKLARLIEDKDKTGMCIAFEPVPQNFEQLEIHKKIFNLQNIKLKNVAVGSESKKCVEMRVPYVDGLPLIGHCFVSSDSRTGQITNSPEFFEGGLMRNVRDNATHEAFDVAQVALDDFLLMHPELKVRFLKIDVEGYEENVLLGARELLRRDKPAIQIEMVMTPICIERISNFMIEFGYKLYQLDEASGNNLIATPNSGVGGVKNYYFLNPKDEFFEQ